MSMKHPPPIPELSLSTTPSISATATVASMAFPPRLRTFKPASVAMGLTDATIPLVLFSLHREAVARQAANTARASRTKTKCLFGRIIFLDIFLRHRLARTLHERRQVQLAFPSGHDR